MKRRRLPDQGSMLTLMGFKPEKGVQPRLHITKEVRDEKDNVLELHTVGVPDDDEEEEETGWAYWLSHTGGTYHG